MSVVRPKLMKRVADLMRMRQILHPKDFAAEAELANTKWFAYSFMSPIEATEEFARVYTSRLQWYVRRNIDRELAERVAGVRPGTPPQRTAQFTQLWRARQKADEFGVPYDVLFDFGFDFAGQRTRKHAPLPHQIFSTVQSEEAWWSLFQVDLDEKIEHAMRRLEKPHYRLEHDRGLPVQRHFRQWIKDVLATSVRNQVDHVGWIAGTKRYLSLEECLSALPPERAEEVSERVAYELNAGRVEREPIAELEDDDFLIGCFGISEAISSPKTDCSACPLQNLCENAASMAERATEKRTGYVSPVAEADRERNRRKVATHRGRKKVAELAAAYAQTAA